MRDSTTSDSSERSAGGGASNDDPWTGGWDDEPTETEDEPPHSAERNHSGIPDPESLPPATDPTGAVWWKVLSIGTILTVVGFVLIWPLFEVGLPAETEPISTVLGDPLSIGALVGSVFLVAIRALVLPVALWRDATLVREADVDWVPSRRFYMAVGALWASLGCGYYLYKRSRYTGRPWVPVAEERLYFTDQLVPSNWQFVVVLGFTTELLILLPEAILTFASSPAVENFAIGPILLLFAARFVFLPVAYYKDSQAVTESDVDWNPRTWFYVTFGYVFAFFVGIYYVAKRGGVDAD